MKIADEHRARPPGNPLEAPRVPHFSLVLGEVGILTFVEAELAGTLHRKHGNEHETRMERNQKAESKDLDSGNAKTIALQEVRSTLDRRYDDLKSGEVRAIDGESAFPELRRKSERRRKRECLNDRTRLREAWDEFFGDNGR